jgi:hypothetical protein
MDSNEAVEVRSSPGRGLGIFATKDLPRGFRVFEEQPMMHFPDERFTDEEIQEVFDHLSMEEQSEFQKLHLGSHIEGQSRITSIFFTNSFGHRSGPMLFLKSSRVNHSCIPNALAAWNSKIERQTIQLTRAVVIGEEITITYCDPRMEFEDRWQTLRTDWNFDCNCTYM